MSTTQTIKRRPTVRGPFSLQVAHSAAQHCAAECATLSVLICRHLNTTVRHTNAIRGVEDATSLRHSSNTISTRTERTRVIASCESVASCRSEVKSVAEIENGRDILPWIVAHSIHVSYPARIFLCSRRANQINSRIGLALSSTKYCGRPVRSVSVAFSGSMPRLW